MRKLTIAALAGVTLAGGGLAGAAAAQPKAIPPAFQSHSADHLYEGPVFTRPSPTAAAGATVGMSVLSALFGPAAAEYAARVPVDRYGPNPHGMVAPDGRRIKCKLDRAIDPHTGVYATRRECWKR